MPIIVFYCEGCREPVTDRKILDRVVELFARAHGRHLVRAHGGGTAAAGLRRARSAAAREFAKETDILDVWFDSGSSHLAVLNERFGLPWPADVYLEGGDQYRGWFHSSLLVGIGLQGRRAVSRAAPPTAGCSMAKARRCTSRSATRSSRRRSSSSTAPRSCGCGSRRSSSTKTCACRETILTRLVEAYRKLRNTFRYMLGNLADFDPATDAVPAGEMPEIDQWILLRAEDLVARCRAWYDDFEFHKVYHAIYDFATVDLSAVYFDVLKDRLYTSAPKSQARRSAQTALYRLLDALVRLLAPLLSFTAEEVWGHMGRTGERPHGVFPGARAN